MVQQFKQFRYNNNSSSLNFPTDLTDADLVSGECFIDYLPAIQLGVQSLPGTKFYINDATRPVIVGFTGIFELDFSQGGAITSLAFDEQSMAAIRSNDSASLIIDIAYVGGNN